MILDHTFMIYLTASERKAILITVSIITAGVLVQWIRPFTRNTTKLDYTVSDSIFYRLSYQKVIKSDKTDKVSLNKTLKTHKSPLNSINLNLANKTELTRLPRIGPKTAERIINYREKNGGFKNNKELMNVKGIGPKTFAKIKPFLKEIGPP